MRNYTAAEKLKEMTGELYQCVQIIPRYLFSRNSCQNVGNHLICCDSAKNWMVSGAVKTNQYLLKHFANLTEIFGYLETWTDLDVGFKSSLA